MADRHTAEEWAYLIDQLEKIANDPSESRERRTKAQGILDRMGRERIAQHRLDAQRKQAERAWTDMDFDGTYL